MDSIEADAGTSPTTNMVKVPLVLDMFKLFNNLPLQTFIRILSILFEQIKLHKFIIKNSIYNPRRRNTFY